MIINSILAGVMIGIGAIANATVGGVVGSILFCVGLLTVLYYQFDLVTGKAHLVPTKELDFGKLLEILILNLAGAWIVGKLYYIIQPIDVKLNTVILVMEKNNAGHLQSFIKGIFCGLLMFLAVTSYKVSGKLVLTTLAVSTFVLLKASHCVADMLYLSLSGLGIKTYLFICPVILGNLVGCMLIPSLGLLKKLNKKKS